MDILSTSGINQLVNSYMYSEQQKLLTPVETKKNNYSLLSSTWGTLKSKLDSLKSVLSDLKVSSSSSIFNSHSAVLSNSDFFSVTADKDATVSSYQVRVNQLAKSDLLVSDTMTSDTAVTTLAGTHTFSVTSGNYTANVDVDLTSSETNDTIMDKISAAINADKAVINSASLNSSSTFTGTGSFDLVIGDSSSSTTHTISYDYTNKTYSEVMDDLVSQLSLIDGISAEKVVDGSNVSLQITGTDESKYITMDSSTDTAGLLNGSNLNINETDVMGASGLATGSVFSPTTGNSKMSITAVNSGYDNRLILADVTGSALSSVGLNSSILSSRTMAADDYTAGYMYTVNSSTDNELNAQLSFNGINVQRNTNEVDDLVSGLSFSLKSVMEASDTTVSVNVSHDSDSIKSKISEFIKSFNDAYTYIRANQASGGDSSLRGIFTGDSTVNSLKTTLQNTVFQSISGIASGNLSRLSEIGITFDPETGLTLSDSSTLETEIKDHSDEVAALFNSSNGVASSLYSTLSNYVGADGTIAHITDSIDNSINYLKDRIDNINGRIDKGAEVLRSKYQALQQQMAVLMSSSGYLNSLGGGMF